MNKQKPYNKTGKVISPEDMMRYVSGEMTPEEMHLLEKAALDAPFLADAVEGFESVGDADALQADLEELHEKTTTRISRKKRFTVGSPILRWSVAAVLTLLIGFSVFFITQNPADDNPLVTDSKEYKSKDIPKESIEAAKPGLNQSDEKKLPPAVSELEPKIKEEIPESELADEEAIIGELREEGQSRFDEKEKPSPIGLSGIEPDDRLARAKRDEFDNDESKAETTVKQEGNKDTEEVVAAEPVPKSKTREQPTADEYSPVDKNQQTAKKFKKSKLNPVNNSSSGVISSTFGTSISTAKTKYTFTEPIVLNFTVTNTSDEAGQFCRWQTPLESSFTAGFLHIVDENGEKLSYIGPNLDRAPPSNEDYEKIKSGKSLSGSINIKSGYSFTQPGTYKIQFIGGLINGLPNSNVITIQIED